MTLGQAVGAAFIVLVWVGMMNLMNTLYPDGPVFTLLVATIPVIALALLLPHGKRAVSDLWRRWRRNEHLR